jgi:hypothetical protein
MNITISTSTTAIEAHIIRGRLEAEGIPAFVAFEHHVWAKWWLSHALGGVCVQVPPAYVNDANQIITNINNGKYLAELEDEIPFSEPTLCPFCNSDSTAQVDWPWRLALLSIILLSLPIPYTQHLTKCTFCSYTWTASEQRGYPLYIPAISILVLSAILYLLFALWCQWCKLNCEQLLCI